LRWTVRGIGLVSLFILARLLSPADFGLVAMATVVTALVTALSQIGLHQALIRHPDPSRDYYNTVWTINLALLATITLILFCTAPLVARYFQEPRITDIVRLLSLGAAISGLTNIGIVDLQKNLLYGKDFQYRTSARLIVFFITILCAFAFRDYRALVAGILCHYLALMVLSYTFHPYRPKPSLACARDLVDFSKWVFISSMARAVFTRADRLIVGGIAESSVMGAYSVSQDLGRMFTAELSGSISRPLLPGAAKIQHDPEKIRRLTIIAAGVFACLAAPFAFGLSATAGNFIPTVLGEHWLYAVPFAEILSLEMGVRAIRAFVPPLYVATGRVRQLALLNIFEAFCVVSALITVIDMGAPAIAITRLTIGCALYPVAIICLTGGRLPLAGQTLWTAGRPILAAALMFGIVKLLHLENLESPIQSLVLDIAVGAISYPILVWGVWRLAGRPHGAESEILDRGRRLILKVVKGEAEPKILR
jgi:lipopolysaccharide exporter